MDSGITVGFENLMAIGRVFKKAHANLRSVINLWIAMRGKDFMVSDTGEPFNDWRTGASMHKAPSPVEALSLLRGDLLWKNKRDIKLVAIKDGVTFITDSEHDKVYDLLEMLYTNRTM